MSPNELLAGGYRMGSQMLHALVDELTNEEFHHQPLPGTNSAAWIVGHLTVTIRRTAERLGATGLPELTEEFVGQFSVTKKPAESQAELGEKTALLAMFDTCMNKLLEAIRTIPIESLNTPPAGRIPFATTYGEAVLFGAMHITLHCGQLSTIRRSLGKLPLA